MKNPCRPLFLTDRSYLVSHSKDMIELTHDVKQEVPTIIESSKVIFHEIFQGEVSRQSSS